jgi:hypothetical protein
MSEKKIYSSEFQFESENENQNFRLFNDNDIGFSQRWQQQLKCAEMDDDVDTDEDQLQAAGRHIMKELGEGIRAYEKNKRNVRNLHLRNFNIN